MKKQIYTVLTLSLLLFSCKQGEVEYVEFDTFKPFSVKQTEVVDENGVLSDEIQIPAEPTIGDDGVEQRRIASITATDFVRNLVGAVEHRKVVQIAGTYTGHDIDGQPITLSGKLFLPAKGKIKNIIAVSHYTVCANYEVPSETFSFEGLLATKGYAVVMADYLGYGVTAHRIHPYMHTESTARSVVDFTLAIIPYLKHIGREPESDQLILFGYSQGGSTTMKVLQLLQDEHPELYIKQVYAGAGPYDLTATYDVSMAQDHTGYPCAIPLIVQGINEGEHMNFDMAYFFQPRLLENYNEWLNTKKYTSHEINEMINVRQLSQIMTPDACNKQSAETARFYKALMRNSTLNFTPKAPVLMFHSRQDDTVPFVNSEKAEQAFKGANVRYDFDNYGTHVKGFLQFIKKVMKEL